MKTTKLPLLLLFMLLQSALYSQTSDSIKVREVLVDSYVNGLIDAKDFGKAREGIHEEFMILGHKDTLLTKKTRDQWIEQRAKRGYLPEVDYTIEYIDIVGDAASAKLLLKRGEITATDYVFLYRFNDKWRIVSAIDHVAINSDE